jgi:radical SAM superfamily enzyme YgiQ (UPF0313 family)
MMYEANKILLAVMPYWDPLLPPLGIACLKSFLERNGYRVKTVDANIEPRFKEIYDRYFETLMRFIPAGKRSNFNNIGKDVLRNHLMAHIHYENEQDYVELVRILVSRTFYHMISAAQAKELNKWAEVFYGRLQDYIHGLLEAEKPGVFGLSVFKGALPASLFALRVAKQYRPYLKTVMGGGVFADQLAMDSPDWEFFLEKTPYIDHMIPGEGEMLFLKYLQGELPESRRVYTLKDIGDKMMDLSSLPLPDFSDFNLDYYPYLGAYTSRSCPFQCNFCSETIGWGSYRKKEARQVVKELETLYRTYGSRLFLLSDSLLNPTISGLCRELLEARLSVYFDGYLRVGEDSCDLDNTLLWRRGGFYRARLGVESGSPKVLELMNKHITPHQIKATVSHLAHAGIKTTTYWVIGYPGETEADFQQTLDLVEELKNDIYEAEFNAFWFFLKGQVKSGEWEREQKSTLLYPAEAKHMLILPTYILETAPSREEIYSRMGRFTRHITRLNLPNPYSLHDIHQADERWKKLHKNSVPSLLELKSQPLHPPFDDNEARRVKKYTLAQDKMGDDINFGF